MRSAPNGRCPRRPPENRVRNRAVPPGSKTKRTRSAVEELGEQFLPIMRHELQGRFAENQPFLGEREKQRATILLLEARGQRRSAPDSHSIK